MSLSSSLLAQSWSELGGLNGLGANSFIFSICSDAPGNIYASGQFFNSSNNKYVAKYNGTSWSELGGLNGLAANNDIYPICSDATGNIYVTGSTTGGLDGNALTGTQDFFITKYDSLVIV